MLVDPGVFNKTIIQLGLAGYKMIITNAALRASLVISITSYTVRPPRIIVKCNFRQYCFVLLVLITAVLMLRWSLGLKSHTQMSHPCDTSKPCQSAQTSELLNMHNC